MTPVRCVSTCSARTRAPSAFPPATRRCARSWVSPCGFATPPSATSTSPQGGGRPFNAEDEELVSLLAAQAAVAIENARLYESSRTWSRQLESLNELSEALTRTIELPAVLELTTPAARAAQRAGRDGRPPERGRGRARGRGRRRGRRAAAGGDAAPRAPTRRWARRSCSAAAPGSTRCSKTLRSIRPPLASSAPPPPSSAARRRREGTRRPHRVGQAGRGAALQRCRPPPRRGLREPRRSRSSWPSASAASRSRRCSRGRSASGSGSARAPRPDAADTGDAPGQPRRRRASRRPRFAPASQPLRTRADRPGSADAARDIADLRPSVLDEFGAEAALHALAERARPLGLEVTLRLDLASTKRPRGHRLTPELEVAIYRIVQEALNNAAKHWGYPAPRRASTSTTVRSRWSSRMRGAASTARHDASPASVCSGSRSASTC